MRAFSLLLILLVPVAGREARADQQPMSGASVSKAQKELAKKRYEAGKLRYNAQLYDDAVKEFQAAYLAWPNPLFLFNIGQALRNGGKKEPALAAYERYLSESPNASDAAEVRATIEQLRAELASAATPAPVVAPVEPHPPPPPPPRFSSLRTIGVGLAGGGLVLAGVGVGLLAWAGSTSGEYDTAYSKCFAMSSTAACHDATLGTLRSRGQTLDLAGGVLVGAGVLAAGVGVYLYLAHRRPESATNARVVPLVGPGSIGLAGVW